MEESMPWMREKNSQPRSRDPLLRLDLTQDPDRNHRHPSVVNPPTVGADKHTSTNTVLGIY